MVRGPYRSPLERQQALAAAPVRSKHLILRLAAAILALAAAAVAVGVVTGTESDEGRTWAFVEDTADPTHLGLRTGIPGSGLWRLEDHEEATGSRALVNHAGASGERPAVAVAAGASRRDVLVETRCRTASGTAERACGVVFRHASDDHHYVARVDVASGRVLLAVVLAGSERVLGAKEIGGATDQWHEIEVRAQGDHLVVLHGGVPAIDVRDPTYANAGGVGLWAPADCIAYFDHLTIEPLPPVPHPTDLIPFLL